MKTLFRSALAAVALMAMAASSSVASAADTVKSATYAVGEKLDAIVFAFMARVGLVQFLTSYTDAYTGKFPVRTQPIDSGLLPVCIPFDLPAANPTANDLLVLAKVPAGVQIADWNVQTEDADSNGAPTLEFSIGSMNAGLTDLSTVYAATVATGETGGLTRASTSAAFAEASTAERVIGLKWTTAAATYVAGKKGLLTLYLRG